MSIQGVLLDLDGTVYRGSEEVPGASQFVAFLRRRGVRPLFITNRSTRTADEICRQLRDLDMPCTPDDVLTSGQAAARLLSKRSAHVVGEDGLIEEMQREGVRMSDIRPEAVVVGLDRQFTYAKLAIASRLIRQGARFIATNSDAVMAVEDGLIPGAGSLVAAIATASGVEPTVIGKPGTTLIQMGLDRLGLRADQAVAIGDNLQTDIVAGVKAGLRTALILTGVSTRSEAAAFPVRPTWIVEDYAELTELFERELNGERSSG